MKRLVAGILVLVLLGGALDIWWQKGTKPVNPNDTTKHIFVVQSGESVREVGNRLKQQGLINDPVVFFLLVKQLGLDGNIQAGDFELSASQSAEDIAETLTHGVADIQVTIPEGRRAEEIADLLKQKLPKFSDTWRNELDKHEGYLFPDTYRFPKEATVSDVISIMEKNFDKKYQSLANVTSTLPQSQIVIIASMVEREAKMKTDRSLVTSVILNRLKLGMALQIDATVQYALGYQPAETTWWKKDLTDADLKLDSPYNTYVNVGLPPTPISNPGFDVLQAVANPAQTNYLYYMSDASGHNHYAATLAQHEANIQKYGP